jgi:isopentenyldiphosphate isomerase
MNNDLKELHEVLSCCVFNAAKQLHLQQCDESGARNPDRYDNEGKQLKEKLTKLTTMRAMLEEIL